jgi:hypothetical protein
LLFADVVTRKNEFMKITAIFDIDCKFAAPEAVLNDNEAQGVDLVVNFWG